jgi:nicotinamide-nucleotide amidase
MISPTDLELQGLAERLSNRLISGQLRLVTAESCTGGWIAKVCTDLPGSSNWFLGGVVSYANEAKTRMLGVDGDVVGQYGAVSEPVVRAMAAGALQHLGGDLSVAVSGIAGPDGGTPGKPAGTVWFAWGRRDGDAIQVDVALEHFEGNREAVRRLTVQRALQHLLAS